MSGQDNPIADHISYRLYALPGKKNAPETELARTYMPQRQYFLTPGRYRIVSQYGSINAKSTTDIALKAGRDKDLVIQHVRRAQQNWLYSDRKGRFPRIEVFWRVFEKEDKEILADQPANAEISIKIRRL